MSAKQHTFAEDKEQYGLNLTVLSSKKDLAAITQDERNDQDVRKNISKMKNDLQKLDVAKAFKSYVLDKKIRVPDFLKSVKVVGKRDGIALHINTQSGADGALRLGFKHTQPSPVKVNKQITGTVSWIGKTTE